MKREWPIIVLIWVAGFLVFYVTIFAIRSIVKSEHNHHLEAEMAITRVPEAEPTPWELHARGLVMNLEALFAAGYSNITYLTNVHTLAAWKGGIPEKLTVTPPPK